jgi:hypothetical protein
MPTGKEIAMKTEEQELEVLDEGTENTDRVPACCAGSTVARN